MKLETKEISHKEKDPVQFETISNFKNQNEVKEYKSDLTNSKKGNLKIFWIVLIGIILIFIVIGLTIGLIYGLREEGDLIKVRSKTAKIGFSLDDFPEELRAGIVEKLKYQDDGVWINRVNKQLSLTGFRMAFRASFYPGKKQLMLPTPNHFDIKFLTQPVIETIDGHPVLTREYILETYIIGKKGSAKVSDPALENIGGSVTEKFVMPVDPTLIFQKTEYACMDEDAFPRNSVDPESVEVYYDDSCEASQPPDGISICDSDISGCHCTKGSELDCVDAIKNNIGRVLLEINFERIEMDYDLAEKIEGKNLYHPNPKAKGADLVGMVEGYKNNLIIYKYISCEESCEKSECLKDKCGWRRLFLFDNIDINVGTDTLHVADVEYTDKESEFDEEKFHNMFYYDPCHKHPHFAGYVGYDVEGLPGSKLGFCTQDTNRIINDRKYNIYGQYDTCKSQGISAGWGDNYNRGIPCQWMDITELPESRKSVEFTVVANPLNYMCEGIRKKNPDGTDMVEETGILTEEPLYQEAGNKIYKYSCDQSPGALENNEHSIIFDVPYKGGSILTSKCKYPYFPIGPKRDCEFALIEDNNDCQPGNPVIKKCRNNGNNNIVLRFCESSHALGTGTACRYNDDSLLANQVLKSQEELNINFTCPSPRDYTLETGGKFSIYIGNLFNEGVLNLNDFSFTCVDI